jgi:hypothetical protein
MVRIARGARTEPSGTGALTYLRLAVGVGASTVPSGSVESVAKYSLQSFRKKLWVARAERHGVALCRVGPVSHQPPPQ